MSKPVKLLMTWNIRPGKEEVYLQFITQEFPESMLKANLQPTDAWYTVYGDWPEVMMGFMAEDLEALKKFLTSKAWAEIKTKLMVYIKDYRHKVLYLERGFQI
jgi:hypothetical protein